MTSLSANESRERNPYDTPMAAPVAVVKQAVRRSPGWAWGLVVVCLMVSAVPMFDLIAELSYAWGSLAANPSGGIVALWLSGIRHSITAFVWSLLPVLFSAVLCYRCGAKRVNMLLFWGTGVLIAAPFFLAFGSSMIIMWMAQ